MVRSILFLIIVIPLLLRPAAAKQQPQPDDYFNFLQQTYFENTRDSLNTFLTRELSIFQQRFPNYRQLDQILWMLAELERRQGRPISALFDYLKIEYISPRSKLKGQVDERIKGILNENQTLSQLQQEAIMQLIERDLNFGDRPEACFQYLTFLLSINESGFSNRILAEIDLYQRMFPGVHDKDDILCFWQGRLHERLHQPFSAAGYYTKLISLYPESDMFMQATFRKAMLNYKEIGRIQEAVEAFIIVINSAENPKLAGSAQFYLAEIYREPLNKLEEALNNYRLFVEAFPNHRYYGRALRHIAGIARQLNRHEEAITAYMQFFEHAPHDTFAAEAIRTIADIYIEQFNNYERAAEVLKVFVAHNKSHPRAPQFIYDAARYYMENLDNRSRSRALCDTIIAYYPESKWAERAKSLKKK